jgi:transposase InsO family protein
MREGVVMNHKKLRRLYREERLQVRRRSERKRAVGTRAPMALLLGPNQRWSLDFLSDAFADGRRFRILTIVDASDQLGSFWHGWNVPNRFHHRSDRLDLAVEQAIDACAGDLRSTIRALILANEFLQTELEMQVSHGYKRGVIHGRLKTYSGWAPLKLH